MYLLQMKVNQFFISFLNILISIIILWIFSHNSTMTQHTVYPSEAHVNGQRGYYYSRRSNLLLVVAVVHYLVLYSMYIMCMATTKYLQSFF